MYYTPDQIRAFITEYCEDIDGGRISDGFSSLMNFIDLDTLVKWFYEEVCCSEPEIYLSSDHADELSEDYNAHCR